MRHSLGPLRGICALAVLCGPMIATDSVQAQKCLHSGFKVEVLLETPELEHPSVVACDDEGNLFIGENPLNMPGPVSTESYRILRVEFGADGKVKKRTVYCENLAGVCGMVWHDGTLYVMHAPHYTMFKDGDGDGVAEIRKDFADGFGPLTGKMRSHENVVTGTQLGLDGLVYVLVGGPGIPKATGSDGSTISLEGGGIIRMRPDGSQLEIFSSGTSDHRDLAIDTLDHLFTDDRPNGDQRWPARFTQQVETGINGSPDEGQTPADRSMPPISEREVGGTTGMACYREAYWPAKYRNSVFCCDWGRQVVQLVTLKKTAATFEADKEDFLVSEDGSEFRPQDACFSPDGNSLFVATWNIGAPSDPKFLGRLYRVTYEGEGTSKSGMMMAMGANGARVTTQLTALSNQSYSTRIQAQHALSRGDERAIAGATLVLNEPRTPTRAKVHAIWAQNGLMDAHKEYNPTPDWVKALSDKDADVRAQAARALGVRLATSVWAESSASRQIRRPCVPSVKNAEAVPALCQALQDSDQEVVLYAAVSLGRIGDPAAVEPLLDALRQPDFIAQLTIMQALRAINRWEPALTRALSEDWEVAQPTIQAMTTVYDESAVKVLANVLQNAPLPEMQLQALEALVEVAGQYEPHFKDSPEQQHATRAESPRKKVDWAGTPAVQAAIESALKHSSPMIREAAARSQQSVDVPKNSPTSESH